MVMRAGKSLVKRWKTAGTGVAVLMILRALDAADVWPQEPNEPRLDEEISKQDKIYQRRGSDVPRGYVTNRGLTNYAELLPAGFCAALGKLGR